MRSPRNTYAGVAFKAYEDGYERASLEWRIVAYALFFVGTFVGGVVGWLLGAS